MPTANSMRYAHSDGFTDVCFEESGRYILTCGSDGDVRIWDGIEDDDAISHRSGDKVFAIAYKENRYFTATDTNTVQAYTFPDGTPDGIITRFTAPANHIVLNKTGTTLVAGSSDFAINVVDTNNCSYKSCQGHEAPVLSVALDPKEEFLASSSCDGTVRVWKLSDRSQVFSLSLIPQCSDPSLSKTVCRMCWEPKEGKILYVPVLKEIHVYDRQTWTKSSTITDPCITEYISVLALSPDGQFLAAGCSDGWICIFNVQTKKCVDKHRNEKGLSVTSLAWNPKGNMELVFCDNQGQLGLLSDIETSGVSMETETTNEDNAVAAGVFDDEDDDFLIQATNDNGDQDDSDVDADNGTRIARPAVLSDDDADSLAGFHKPDDDDASSVTSEKSEPPKPEIRVEGYKPTPMQRPFQPGSTPEHLSSRFMVWNSIGIVKQYNSEEENSIDIEFHDTSVHHAMHITNSSNYTMADLSSEAVLLAAEGESGSPSKLTCMHFSSWDNNKEWSVTMPDDEDIQCVTVGDGWVAMATDTRNVRLMTITGVQREMFSVPGPVVCMCAHGGQLMVVYHRAMGIPGDQCLGVTLMDVKDWRKEISEEPLPLAPKATLNWTGFSAEGTPFYMDSAGVVRMLNRHACKTWIQVANTRDHAKGKSDHYWIVGISENPQQLRCIPCKGARYPATLPRPAMTVMPFQVPLCEMNTEKSQYEEMLWRTRLLTGHFDIWTKQQYEFDENLKTEAQKPAQEALMKLFALSARSEREYRALDVCEMMTDQHTLQLAIKYSSRMRYIQLAQRISEMAVRKAEEEQAKANSHSYEEEYTASEYGRRSYTRQEDSADATQEDQVEMETGEEEEEERPSGPMLALKSKEGKQDTQSLNNSLNMRSNPFKVSTPHPSSALTKGTQVFDSLTKKKEKITPLSFAGHDSKPPKKGSQRSQPKIFLKKRENNKKASSTTSEATTEMPVQKAKSGFDLWLDENKDRLVESKPEADEDDFNKYAVEQFRALPKEERQGWVKKAKASTETSKENEGEETVTADNVENKKRKREDVDSDETAKKLKDSSANEQKKKPLSQTTNSKLSSFAFKKDDS